MSPSQGPEELGAWVASLVGSGAAFRDLETARRDRREALERLARPDRELPSGVDPTDLRRTGWGAVFPHGRKTRLAEALRPLLNRRRRQAGERFRLFTSRIGENGEVFLKDRGGEHLGTLSLKEMPYYLLLVASPEEISFEFQYHLSLSHAVGRIAFDSRDGYRRYAEGVVRAESLGRKRARSIGLFAVENDRATRLLGEHLCRPVQHRLLTEFPEWSLSVRPFSRATKESLAEMLGGKETPGLLITSCHGRRCPPGSPHQAREQGSVVCEPEDGRPSVFSKEDLDAPEGLGGLIAFFFGCYSAGTPVLDSFPHELGRPPESALHAEPRILSPKPFLARLPLAMLEQGAGAVVGHIDRGWTTSFAWPAGNLSISTPETFEDGLSLLLRGHRLGHAMAPLRRRYAQLASKLAQMLDVVRMGGTPDLKRLGVYWTAVNDARNLVILGDPAVFVPGRLDAGASVAVAPELYRRIQERSREDGVTVEAWVGSRLEAAL